MTELTIAQKYYNVARAMCRACAAEHVSVAYVVVAISKSDYEALWSMVGKYPTVQYADGKLTIFNVRFISRTPQVKKRT